MTELIEKIKAWVLAYLIHFVLKLAKVCGYNVAFFVEDD